jgi:hypothetical protein
MVKVSNILDSQEFIEGGKTIVKYAYKSEEVKPKINQDYIEKKYETYTEEVNGKLIEKQKLDKSGQPIILEEKIMITEEVVEMRTAHTITSKVIGEEGKYAQQSGYNFVKDNEGWKEVKYATTTKTEFDRANKVSFIQRVLAAEVGPNSPNQTTQYDYGGQNWTNPDNIKVSDNVYATNALTSNSYNALVGYDLGFAIPVSSTVTGMKVEVEGKSSSTSRNIYVSVVDNATSPSIGSSKVFTITTSEQYYSTGGDGDTWYGLWTPATINSTGFGAYLDNDGNSITETFSIDHLRVTIYYKTNLISVTKSAGLGTNNNATGTVAWNSPTNIYASDNVYATTSLISSAVSNYLQATNFGFNIPNSVNIEGIMISIEGKTTNNSAAISNSFTILKNATTSGDNTTNFSLSATERTLFIGGSQSLLGNTLTPADINNSGFGYQMSFKVRPPSGTQLISIDYVEITVFYSEGSSNTKTQIRSSAQFKSNVIIK